MRKISIKSAGSDVLSKEPAYGAITLLAFIITLLLLSYHLWQTRVQVLDLAAINTKNLAWVLEERLDSTFRRVDADLAQIASKTGTMNLAAATQEDLSAWTNYLIGFKTNFPEVNGFYIFNARGQEITSSEPNAPLINIADRDHFQHLRDNADCELTFSDVLISRTNNRPMMVVARRIQNKNGQFAGIVSATVDLDYLQKLFDSIEIGEHGAIGLMRTDNQKLVFRHPASTADYNREFISIQAQRISSGEKVGVERYLSPVDNIMRIGSFHVLNSYPFFVNVAIAETDVLAQWRILSLRSTAGTALLLAALAFLQFRLQQAEALRRSAIQKLDQIAQIDELTSLPNRRNFMMRAEVELYRTVRQGDSMSVLMMDIDNFKTINDTYGHKTGDEVLKCLAQLCQQSLRQYDIVGRIGGEEFAFLLPKTEITLGVEIAERMRKNIEATAVKAEDGQLIQFTVSIGVTALRNENDSIDSLLGQSDKAMYEAKHAGRNRVYVYEPKTAV